MAARFTAYASFKAIDKMTKPFKAMTRASRSFASKTEAAFARVNRRVNRLKKSIGSFGMILGGAALLGAATSMIGVFADFEQANASLASVLSSATGPELVAMQEDAKRLGATTAKTASEVVGLQEAFGRLGFSGKEIINMTEATISGSIAMQGELGDTAELVGAMIKSFDKFSDVDTTDIIDKMTLATQKSALNFEKLQTGLPIVAGAANAAKVPFTRLVASMGKLSDAGIDASSSSTALRNIFLEAAKQGVPFQKLIDKVKNSTDQLATANALFGKRGAVAAVILAKNTDAVAKLDKELQKAGGTAGVAAAKQLDTLKGRLTILNSAWEGFILSVEDGNGKLGKFLNTTIAVATEILSMASETAKAREELTGTELSIRKLAEKGMLLVKTIKWLVIGLVAYKAIMIANKAVMIGSSIALGALNIVMGVSNALAGKSAFLVQGNTVAYAAFRVAVLAQTAAQWLFAAAVNAGLWPILAIIAAIGLLVSIVVSFKKNWDLVKAAFKEGGILKGLFAIGKVILDAILAPVQSLLELLGKIPGLNIATRGAEGIQGFRDKLFEQERALLPEQKQELSNTRTTAAQENISREERISKQKASLEIYTKDDLGTKLDSPNGFPVTVTPTN